MPPCRNFVGTHNRPVPVRMAQVIGGDRGTSFGIIIFITVRGFGGAYYTPYSVPSRVDTLGIVCKVFLQHNEYNEDQCEKHYYGILSDLVMSWPDIRPHPFSMLIPSQIRIILPGRSTRHLLGIESTYLVPTPSSVTGWLRNDHAEVPRSWWMCR